MGIYVFRPEALFRRLAEGSARHADLDFGKHVIPELIGTGKCFAYPFDGYWVDVGTLQSYWETNLALLAPDAPLNLYDPDWVIHTLSQERAPLKISLQGRVARSMICNGSIVDGTVVNSVLSPGVRVLPGAVVRDSIVMNDSWIGPEAVLDRVIVDKNARIGDGVRLVNQAGLDHADGDGYVIRNGIIIVPKDGIVAPGTCV
jgi:glucose-1-phosphate adenylyltransferase